MKKLMLAGVVGILHSSSTFGADKHERWLNVTNDTSALICEVYISHVKALNWQENHLNSCIARGEIRRVDPGHLEGNCLVDMKFVFEDTEVVTEYNFDICTEEGYELVETPEAMA